jgi:hypothetical protein
MTDKSAVLVPEPVVWRIEDLILPYVTITEDADYARRKAEYRYEGEATARVTPLYAAPVSPPSVAEADLRAALEQILKVTAMTPVDVISKQRGIAHRALIASSLTGEG